MLAQGTSTSVPSRKQQAKWETSGQAKLESGDAHAACRRMGMPACGMPHGKGRNQKFLCRRAILWRHVLRVASRHCQTNRGGQAAKDKENAPATSSQGKATVIRNALACLLARAWLGRFRNSQSHPAPASLSFTNGYYSPPTRISNVLLTILIASTNGSIEEMI